MMRKDDQSALVALCLALGLALDRAITGQDEVPLAPAESSVRLKLYASPSRMTGRKRTVTAKCAQTVRLYRSN